MYPQCRSVTPDSVAQASVAQDLTVLTIWFKYTEMLFFLLIKNHLVISYIAKSQTLTNVTYQEIFFSEVTVN